MSDASLFLSKVQKPSALVGTVLHDAKFPGRKEHALHVPQEIDGARHFIAVDPEFPPVFIQFRFERDLAVLALRLGEKLRAGRADLDELLVVTDAQRRARAKIKDRLGTIGLALRILPIENVDSFRKAKGLALVISEILKGQIFDDHRSFTEIRFLFLLFCVIIFLRLCRKRPFGVFRPQNGRGFLPNFDTFIHYIKK